jgi:hypothetical protein
MPDASREPIVLRTPAGSITEFPLPTIRIVGARSSRWRRVPWISALLVRTVENPLSERFGNSLQLRLSPHFGACAYDITPDYGTQNQKFANCWMTSISNRLVLLSNRSKKCR